MRALVRVISITVLSYFAAMSYGYLVYENFFPKTLYIFLDILLVITSILIVVLSVNLYRRSRYVAANTLLFVSSIMLAIGMLDAYVVRFRLDTSGPGGIDSYSHVNWYETYVQTNERGYWAPPLAEYETSAPRSHTLMAVIGDSFTWGQGIQGRARRFSEQLERLLNARDGRSVKVLNFGVGGTGTLLQTRQVLADVERVKPDVVLVGYLTNDIEDEVGLMRVEYDLVPFVAKPLGRALPLVNFLYWRFFARSGAQAERSFFAWITAYRDPANYASHAADLRSMFERIKAIPARPVVAILPYPHMWQPFRPWVRDEIHRKLSATFADLGVPVVDLAELERRFPPGAFELNAMDGHPNAAVHRAIAAQLAAWFEARPCYLGPVSQHCDD